METQKTTNLADKIADILNTAPSSFDPEDDAVDATTAQVSHGNIENTNDEEEILSKFRRDNVDLLADLDEKYAGKKTSRKKLRDFDSEEEEISIDNLKSDDDQDEDSNDDDEISKTKSKQNSEEDDDTEGSDDAGSSESEGDEDEDVQLEDDASEINDSNFKHISETNISSQIKKGICVRNQMAMWEHLLEARIQLQKCLLTANKMPQNHTFIEIRKESGPEFTNKVNETKSKLCETLDKLLSLQKLALKHFPETKNLEQHTGTSKKSNEDENEEILSDTDVEKSESEPEETEAPKNKKRSLEQYEEDISTYHKKYKDYRNSVIQKWNDKTRVVLKGATSHSVLDQIEYNLSNKGKLIKRTQMKRSQYTILGEEERNNVNVDEEYNGEIFDDDDFYHQLLRELIEVKSADVTDPIQLGRQWIQLQNLRSKMKRKIDTRATKGRKIRYAVHSKLVNFMAPIDGNFSTDEAKNELYSSLFGKKQAVFNV